MVLTLIASELAAFAVAKAVFDRESEARGPISLSVYVRFFFYF